MAVANPNITPWIRFTFTAVEIREEPDVSGNPLRTKPTKYWLRIDYLDDVHGSAEKAFSCDANIPGFKAQVNTGEWVRDSQGLSLAGHHFVEYLLPYPGGDSVRVYGLRNGVKQALERKTFQLASGEEKVLFEISNLMGGPLKARLNVVPPSKIDPASQRALGKIRLVGTGAFQNLAMLRFESLPAHPLHEVVVRFAGTELSEKVLSAPRAIQGPYVVPSSDEDMGTPVREPMANGDGVGTSQFPTASAIKVDCPGDYSFSFVLPDESSAREASKQIKERLAQPVTLAANGSCVLFQLDNRIAWLELRPFHPAPNKFTFARRNGRSPSSAASNFIECAVTTIPPGSELEIAGRVVHQGQNNSGRLFGTTLTSNSQKPGIYWLTWYSLPNPETMDTRPKEDWRLEIHDELGNEVFAVNAPEELKQGWSRRWVGDSKRAAREGEPILQILFEKKERAGDYLMLEMTMHRSDKPNP